MQMSMRMCSPIALVLLYNPVAPVFAFSGDWPRAVVLAMFAPFVASLATRNVGARVRA